MQPVSPGASPVLTTKITMPARRSGVIGRGRLLSRMDGAQDDSRRLTVIVAPAGFGKTTLVREWCASRSGGDSRQRIAWVSLDGSEDDPARFITYFVMAVRNVYAGFGEGVLSLLGSPQPAPPESVLALLLNDLHALDAPLCLVLDDYHLIAERKVHEAVAYLLEHLPACVHLIIASRVDPPLPLSRLRARGELTELRAADLRCLGEEAREFLTGVMGLTLSNDEVNALETRTEGWMAGLQLAALSLQNRTDAKAFITAFTGSNRYIVDYLGEEVLRQQPERLRRFLFCTSVLHRLSGGLCEAVMGAEMTAGEGQSLLEEMDSSNLFLVALDEERRWYRYHHLFGDMLRIRLQQESPELLPELHRRAAAWYTAEEMYEEAVRHALAGKHYEDAVRLIEECTERLWRRGETQTLTRWMSELPPDVLRRSPRLGLFQARIHVLAAETEKMATVLVAAEETLSPDDPDYRYLLGQLRTYKAFFARIQNDDDRAVTYAEEALELLAPISEAGMWSAVIRLLLGTIYALRGETEHGIHALSEAAAICEKVPDPQMTLITRSIEATLLEEQGKLHQAQATYQKGLDFAATLRMEQLPMAGYAYVGLGSIALARNELDAAEQHLLRGLRLGEEVNAADVYLRGTRLLAQIHLARENHTQARRLLDEMFAYTRGKALPQMAEVAAVTRAQFDLEQGDITAAEAWEQQLPHDALRPKPPYRERQTYAEESFSVFLRDVIGVTRGRLRLAQNRPDEAAQIFVETGENAAVQERFSVQLECKIRTAVAYQACGKTAQAQECLTFALRRARPEGYVRLFLEAGPLLIPLLREAAERGIETDYARMLLAAFSEAGNQTPVAGARLAARKLPPSELADPLTGREIEVLSLVAAGLSNQDIADRLFLSVGTVKRHVHNIFGKLDAGGRVEAITRARTLGLLDDA